MLLIGSHAINHHLPGFRSKPGDVDVIAEEGAVEDLRNRGFVTHEHAGRSLALKSPSGTIWDIELMSPFTQRLRGNNDGAVCDGLKVGLPSLDKLYTLKLSHRYLKNSPHFMKTMLDIHTLRRAGAKVFDWQWLREREKATYHYQHPNLMRGKDQFFRGDSVTYVYDHDQLHQAVKLGDQPAYQRFATPGQEVHSSRSRFEKLDELHKLHAVLEESYVLALERSQIPFPGTSPHVSFRIALEKVCTSITSGWFREYAWENYFAVLALYSPTYVQKFEQARPSLKPLQEAHAT